MAKTEKVSSLRGAYVISEDRGSILGNVTNVFINRDTKKLSEIVFKEDRLFSSYNFLPADCMIKVGIDTVFVKSGKDSKAITDTLKPNGQDIKSLLGYWITTDHGRHLGHFFDFEFDATTRSVTGITFTNGASLTIAPSDLNIGDDEIIVPASIEAKLKKPNLTISMLNRLFGAGSTEQQKPMRKSDLPKMQNLDVSAARAIQH